MYAKKEKIYPAYVSKRNSNQEKQVSNEEKREWSETLATRAKSEGREAKSEGPQLWHYLTVKKLSALLRGITSKHYGDFYYLNCLHSFATEKKNLNRIKKYVKIKIFVTF